MNFLKKIIVGVILNALALYVVVTFVDAVSYSGSYLFFIVSGGILGLINTFLKPLMKFLSFPLVFISGGLFLIVINAIILALLEYSLDILQFRDLAVDFPNWTSYIIGAILLGFTNWLIHLFIKND